MINYILLLVFVGLVIVWKVVKGTKIVKVGEMDVWSGRRQEEFSGPEEENEGGRRRTVWGWMKSIFVG